MQRDKRFDRLLENIAFSLEKHFLRLRACCHRVITTVSSHQTLVITAANHYQNIRHTLLSASLKPVAPSKNKHTGRSGGAFECGLVEFRTARDTRRTLSSVSGRSTVLSWQTRKTVRDVRLHVRRRRKHPLFAIVCQNRFRARKSYSIVGLEPECK